MVERIARSQRGPCTSAQAMRHAIPMLASGSPAVVLAMVPNSHCQLLKASGTQASAMSPSPSTAMAKPNHPNQRHPASGRTKLSCRCSSGLLLNAILSRETENA